MNTLFSQAFQKRIRLLREGAGLTQGEVAAALRISVDAYKKYETRPKSMLPHQYVQAFIDAVHAGPGAYQYLFTGRMAADTSEIEPSPARNRKG